MRFLYLRIFLTLIAVFAFADIAAAERGPAADVYKTLNGRRYISLASSDMTYLLTSPVFGQPSPEGKRLIGRRVVSSFLYSDNSISSGLENCGGLFEDDLNWSVLGPFKGDRKSIYNPGRGTVFACFPNSALYHRYGSNCPLNVIYGATCHVLIAGRLAGPRPFKMQNTFGMVLSAPGYYIEIEQFLMLDRDSKIALNQLKAAVNKLKGVTDFADNPMGYMINH